MDIDFGSWLASKMAEWEWSQSELARRSGLSRQAISYYLSEKSKRPDELAMQSIARAFRLPITEVYRAAGILPPEPAENEHVRRVVQIMNSLPEDEQVGIAEFAKMRLRVTERQAQYGAAQRGKRKPASAG